MLRTAHDAERRATQAAQLREKRQADSAAAWDFDHEVFCYLAQNYKLGGLDGGGGILPGPLCEHNATICRDGGLEELEGVCQMLAVVLQSKRAATEEEAGEGAESKESSDAAAAAAEAAAAEAAAEAADVAAAAAAAEAAAGTVDAVALAAAAEAEAHGKGGYAVWRDPEDDAWRAKDAAPTAAGRDGPADA